ncbi:Fur family transcriptional regulator [Olivibacter sitiensis]|uniref:Fur family transcriptional regulator n=1 Tax=Olivibacter sitiensis TaxID=376470 RepID=UPI00042471ED|nr:transcriptional repressor [Olivibacter sitiensis]
MENLAVDEFVDLLRKNKLKVTNPRLQVLQIMSEREAAISQPELEKMVGGDIDRVTLYRVLSTFEEKGIIHKILDLQGTATYAVCSSSCNDREHHDEHVHFSCEICNKVYCLPESIYPNIAAPKGFLVKHVTINAIGICRYCQMEHKGE